MPEPWLDTNQYITVLPLSSALLDGGERIQINSPSQGAQPRAILFLSIHYHFRSAPNLSSHETLTADTTGIEHVALLRCLRSLGSGNDSAHNYSRRSVLPTSEHGSVPTRRSVAQRRPRASENSLARS
ncbi:uncharacterized protein [Physcomitrium patens]|uniref:Uncharacterized protein n=1 Tax=Physcomitrium patens TaxID=3218 RepID=A0A2K1K096_PHYPA|nr:uncharacterized protein LOC112287621 [Physcomitrium patens]PNR47199.1 hypothetical protein PHYPA_014319 [Physcomitrium patens]|eukprot:XP_024386567.1 uncharacterized protein LOC112287621 [Physcomitrella patens]